MTFGRQMLNHVEKTANIIVKKTLQVKTPFKDDLRHSQI